MKKICLALFMMGAMFNSALAYDLSDVSLSIDENGNAVLTWSISAPSDYRLAIVEGSHNTDWNPETSSYNDFWEWNPIDHLYYTGEGWATTWVDGGSRQAYKVLLEGPLDTYGQYPLVIDSGPLYTP